MARKKVNKFNPENIRGISICKENNKTIYAPFYSQKAYILNENNARHYVNYIVGYIAAMVVFEMVYIFSKNLLLSLLIGLLVLVINFVYFYFNFLKKASIQSDFKKQSKDSLILRQAKMLEYDRIYTLIVCSILLVVIFYFYMLWQKLDGIYLYIVIASIVMSALYGIFNFLILLKKRQLDKK